MELATTTIPILYLFIAAAVIIIFGFLLIQIWAQVNKSILNAEYYEQLNLTVIEELEVNNSLSAIQIARHLNKTIAGDLRGDQ